MRCDCVGIYGWHNHAGISNLRGVSAVAANNACNPGAYSFGVFEGSNQIGADILLKVSAANRKHKNQIFGTQMAGAQPAFENGFPAFIIGARACVGRKKITATLTTRAAARLSIRFSRRFAMLTLSYAEATSAASTSTAIERISTSREITTRSLSFFRSRIPSVPAIGPCTTRTRCPTRK